MKPTPRTSSAEPTVRGDPVMRAVEATARAFYDIERTSPLTQPELGTAITELLPADSRYRIAPSTLYRYRFASHIQHVTLRVFFAMLQVLYPSIPSALESLAQEMRIDVGSARQQTSRQQRRQRLLDVFDRLSDPEQEVALGMMQGILGPLAGALPENAAAVAEAEAAAEEERQQEYDALTERIKESGRQGTARQIASGILPPEGAEQDLDDPRRGGRERREGNGGA